MSDAQVDPYVDDYLRAIFRIVRSPGPLAPRLRAELTALLEYLASPRGRTDANCRGVDHAIDAEDAIWRRIEELESEDDVVADVLRFMSEALHDTVSAPEVAQLRMYS